MNRERAELNCTQAREALLEADLARLEDGSGDTLAGHLGGCENCRSMARMILEGERGLGKAMETLVPAADLDELLERAKREPAGARGAIRRKLRWSARGAVPLAAAAALAALFLGREPVLPGDPVVPLATAPGLGLEVTEGRDVAVLATNNPDITVLWFF